MADDQGHREIINRLYEEKGLDAVWRWAKGNAKRWHSCMNWAKAKAEAAERDLRRERREIENIRGDLHRLAHEIDDLKERLENNKRRIEQAERDGNESWARELRKQRRKLDREVDKLKARVEDKETKQKRNRVQKHDAKQEEKVWIERKIIYREKWEKAKKDHSSGAPGQWESWMAHGLDDNVEPEVLAVMAWGVLEYDLYVTSLRRNYVPPGGSTTSYHLSGKAGDIAGARMSQFQSAVFARFKGNSSALELFGPQNGVNLKYGSPIYLAEGTGLENLHDSHDHFAHA